MDRGKINSKNPVSKSDIGLDRVSVFLLLRELLSFKSLNKFGECNPNACDLLEQIFWCDIKESCDPEENCGAQMLAHDGCAEPRICDRPPNASSPASVSQIVGLPLSKCSSMW